MKRKLIIGMYISLAALLAACSDWINVTPKDQVESDKLFDSEIGFKSALIGVYARMTLSSTYGKNLTYGYVERLVQRYDDPWVTNTFPTSTAALYDYKNNTTAKSMVTSFWTEQFRSIANINNLLARLDNTGKSIVTTDGYWTLMKGEALGLRAFHYFDLLRLFGPVYSQNPQMACLPWRTEFNAEPKALLPASQIVEHILNDLQEAEELLKDDPLDYKDNLNDPFIGLRKHRMNRMAVKALKARVYLWMGDKGKAADEAAEVIDKCGFGLARNNTKDVSLYEETIFCLGMADMATKVRSEWANIDKFSNEYFITKENVQSVFEPNSIGINDIRYKHGYGMIHGSNGFLCRKYLGEEREYREKVPLIRLVEMYYIMAEAVGLQDRNGKNGCWYLNEVRHARGISRNYDIQANTEEELAKALNKEYQKEFFAEGQWFYYLKRNNCSTFYRCPVGDMTSYYVLPTPDDEVEYAAGAE